MADALEKEYQQLRAAARAGRVAFSGFLAPSDADSLLARLNGAGVAAEAWGGHPGARRRVVAAFPDEVPEAKANLTGWYAAGAASEDDLRAAAVAAGVPASHLGDAFLHQDGATLVTFAPLAPQLLALTSVGGRPVQVAEVPVERLGGSSRSVSAVVPSLRVDVLGARAFGVSRAYFAKGVAAGRVSINGAVAGKSASAGQDDQVYADGLGRFQVASVDGETRRGNLKVTLNVERT